MSIQIASSRDFAFFCGLIVGGFLQFAFCILIPPCHLGNHAQKSVASSILQSMQSSAAIYTAQQNKPPKTFSDFIQITGNATGAKTFSLENIKQQLYEPPALNKNQLTIKFKPDGQSKTTYYLKGSDITASYSGF